MPQKFQLKAWSLLSCFDALLQQVRARLRGRNPPLTIPHSTASNGDIFNKQLSLRNYFVTIHHHTKTGIICPFANYAEWLHYFLGIS